MKHLSLLKMFTFGAAAISLLYGGIVQARVEERLSYTKSQSFQAALRFLRVDHGYAVIEKDAESGYLLFEYPKRESGYTQGSIQVVEREETVAVIVQLPNMPSYHERMLIEGLLRKIRDDYGAPPQKKSPDKKPNDAEPAPDPDPPSAPDEPKDGGSDGSSPEKSKPK